MAISAGFEELAGACGVSLPSIKRLETQRGEPAAQPRTVEAIRNALEAAGVIFIDQNGNGPGVRLKGPSHEAYGDSSRTKPRWANQVNGYPAVRWFPYLHRGKILD